MGPYLYANRDGVWPDFVRHDVEIEDGRLVPARLPGPAGPLPEGLPGGPGGPEGLAAAHDGTVFFSVRGAVSRVDPCDGTVSVLACVSGRGLLVHPGRRALLVADPANGVVTLVDLATYQVVDVWEGPCGSGALAGDAAGRVYVAGDDRVEQFTAAGDVVPRFWATLSAQATLAEPVAVAALGTRVHILDRARRVVLVADARGRLLGETELPAEIGDPLALAVTADSIYVGGGRLARLRPDGTYVGLAPGYPGPVAALALDADGVLLVHPGWSAPPLRLDRHAAYVRRGVAWGGPFGGFTPSEKSWHRLAAAMDVPATARVRFYVHTSDDPAAVPPVDPAAAEPFPAPAWTPGPADLGDFLIHRPPGELAWIGVLLGGEGLGDAPAVEQIRLDYDHQGYERHLPAIHQQGPDGVLTRYLALAESLFGEVADDIDGLGRLLAPDATPDLALLARWVGLDLVPSWTPAQARDAVAHALTEAAARGTAAGLRAALRRRTGLETAIEEPFTHAAWWALAGGGTDDRHACLLGVTTVLAAAPPQGSVLGSTALVDESHLLSGEEYAAPLFEEAGAHRFAVRVYRGAAFSADRLRAAREVVERERPAHAAYRMSVVEPLLAIGVQATVGVDTIVGGPPATARLDDDAVLDGALVLGGRPPGQVGERGRIGVTTVLGS
ncbi:phage tail protein [Nonomuraea sp. NPDC002799]